MALFNNYGLICEINPNTKGYTRLTISTNIPFKTKLIKFNVWDTLLLKKPGSTRSNTMIPFKVGEEVLVEYSYKDGYPQLVNLVSARVDNCPVCYSSMEGIDAQRMEVGCDDCRLIPEDEHKRRNMTCNSISFPPYNVKYSPNPSDDPRNHRGKFCFSDR